MSKTTSSPPAPDPIAIVAIPARNEEACLPACLDALAAQRGGIPFAVVVFANNCEDRTVAMACGMQPRLPFRLLVEEVSLPEGCRTAGHARRGAMDLASRIAGEAYKQR